eukprot:TRINITY_DN14259_c0_g2_i1.p1 TRINITY_DN14259_c0_g2~~TRINITY_DN14259_c0_g2_i1.p1  ORF type:complete len:689 (-),score=127.05 TRINITY_DN14259_c0_g2_i1:272-2134(-)
MGYDVRHCTWDVIVKRLDILCTCIITYTNIADDVKAKLLCYAALAGLMLVLHADQKPFENRKTKLLDRMEFAGLGVRWISFTGVELILVFNPYMQVSWVVCAVIVAANVCFVAVLWVHIGIELVHDFANKFTLPTPAESAITAALYKARSQITRGLYKDLKARGAIGFAKFANMGKFAATDLAQKVAKRLDKITEATLVITPVRVGDTLAEQVMPRSTQETPSGRFLGLIKNTLWSLQLYFFRQTNAHQEDFLASVVGELWEHVIVEVRETILVTGSGQVAQFVLIARALKRTIAEKLVPQNAPAFKKAAALKTKLDWAARAHDPDAPKATAGTVQRSPSAESDQDQAKMDKDQEKMDRETRDLSAEDLNSALNVLQRIPHENCKELFDDALHAIDDRRLDAQTESAKDAGCQWTLDDLVPPTRTSEKHEIGDPGLDLLAVLDQEPEAEAHDGPRHASWSDRSPQPSSTPTPNPHAGKSFSLPRTPTPNPHAGKSFSLPRTPTPNPHAGKSFSLPRPFSPPSQNDTLPPATGTGDPLPLEVTGLPRMMMPPAVSALEARLCHWGQEAKIDISAFMALRCVPAQKIDEVLKELESSRMQGISDLSSHTHDVVRRVLRDHDK